MSRFRDPPPRSFLVLDVERLWALDEHDRYLAAEGLTRADVEATEPPPHAANASDATPQSNALPAFLDSLRITQPPLSYSSFRSTYPPKD